MVVGKVMATDRLHDRLHIVNVMLDSYMQSEHYRSLPENVTGNILNVFRSDLMARDFSMLKVAYTLFKEGKKA